jgi:hypothetical protein
LKNLYSVALAFLRPDGTLALSAGWQWADTPADAASLGVKACAQHLHLEWRHVDTACCLIPEEVLNTRPDEQ